MEGIKVDLNTPVIVNLKFWLSEVILEKHGFFALSQILAVLGVDFSFDGSFHVHNDHFRVETAAG